VQAAVYNSCTGSECRSLYSLTNNSIKSVFSSPFLPRHSINGAGWERACPRVGGGWVRVPDKLDSLIPQFDINPVLFKYDRPADIKPTRHFIPVT